MIETLRRRVVLLQRWESGTVRVLGLIELLFALMFFVVGLYSALVGEDPWIFLTPAIPLTPLGLFQTVFFSNRKRLTSSLGILLIGEVWILSFAILSIPFLLYGMSPIDAIFESISGFTTTGASIVADIESLPSGLLLWRALTEWSGGITIVLIFTILLPMLGVSSSGVASNEFASPGSGGYRLKVATAAMNFMRVFVMLTFIEIVLLAALGVSLFDSVCISMSNIPTGGLLPRNDSMASYSIWVQGVTLVFMFLGATNYYLLFRLATKKDTSLLRNAEFRRMAEWFAACILLISAVLLVNDWQEVGNNALDGMGSQIWKTAYCVVSAGTGTGFVIADYTLWPTLVMTLLIVVAFVGGMSGSTAGGIKIYRLLIIKSYIRSGLSKILHPGAVTPVRIGGEALNDSAVKSALSTVLMMIIGAVTGACLILMFQPSLDTHTAFGLAVAAIGNYGLGNGTVGPMDSFSDLAMGTKTTMCALMWLGRMEMVLVVIIFTRGFWSDVRLSAGRVSPRSFIQSNRRRNFGTPDSAIGAVMAVPEDIRRPLPVRDPGRRENRVRRQRPPDRGSLSAHREYAEDRRIARLNLVNRPCGDLGLPERTLVGETVTDRLKGAQMAFLHPQGFRGVCPRGGGIAPDPLVVGHQRVSVRGLVLESLPGILAGLLVAVGETQGGDVRPSGGIRVARSLESCGIGDGFVMTSQGTQHLDAQDLHRFLGLRHGVYLGEGVLVASETVHDRPPRPADPVSGFQVQEDPVRVLQTSETDETRGNLITVSLVLGEIGHEDAHHAGELLSPPYRPQHGGAGQQGHRILLAGRSQFQDLGPRDLVIPILYVFPYLGKSPVTIHFHHPDIPTQQI